MSDVLIALGAVAIVVCLPLAIIMHYITRWRQGREISRDDEQMLDELWQLAQKVEERVETLERILDDEEQNWRSKT